LFIVSIVVVIVVGPDLSFDSILICPGCHLSLLVIVIVVVVVVVIVESPDLSLNSFLISRYVVIIVVTHPYPRGIHVSSPPIITAVIVVIIGIDKRPNLPLNPILIHHNSIIDTHGQPSSFPLWSVVVGNYDC